MTLDSTAIKCPSIDRLSRGDDAIESLSTSLSRAAFATCSHTYFTIYQSYECENKKERVSDNSLLTDAWWLRTISGSQVEEWRGKAYQKRL